MKDSELFLVRVYGICFNPKLELLICDEVYKGKSLTKFPGGGLEYGEGLKDCLYRELKEETGRTFNILGHFYTCDFFVPSAFHAYRQVISVYYKVELEQHTELSNYDMVSHDQQIKFRWIAVRDITPDIFSLPTDKEVARLIRAEQIPAGATV